MNNPVQLAPAMKAFIVHDGKVLIIRESSSYATGTNIGKYDVVGGSVKPGEHFADGLRRKALEEVGLTISIGKPFYVGEWRPQLNGTQRHIVATFFICSTQSSDVHLGHDHDDYQWIEPAAYAQYNIIENLKLAFIAYVKD